MRVQEKSKNRRENYGQISVAKKTKQKKKKFLNMLREQRKVFGTQNLSLLIQRKC